MSEGREYAKDQVSIGVSFTSDWIRIRRECACPITERSEENPLQSLLSTINENCSHARSTMEILKHKKIMGILCPVFRLANVNKDQQLFLEGVSSENVVNAFVL